LLLENAGTIQRMSEHCIPEDLNPRIISDLKSSCFCRYLLQNRADPLIRDAEQNIALHWSAFSGSVDISQMLLDFGCDVNSTNVHGDTPL
jgi:ankyrin repeat protein